MQALEAKARWRKDVGNQRQVNAGDCLGSPAKAGHKDHRHGNLKEVMQVEGSGV